MAKSRNNLLGVGGQRRKMSKGNEPGSPSARAEDRRSAAGQKEDLLRRMRERAQQEGQDGQAAAE
ncbi:hypothetical protein C6N75_15155 [Streptomyces solincola]|uniref:Uncharacterized protein n=1 Tax=Streptomyces solincola TaxID=2100817 RepID=A0A2S9PVF3_9ACTN|nr:MULTISPECIES: DUF6243 family protein [Streptomyces]PRH78389.1 hypothetical protein C6N75_15155 [Streptomyces solincola]